MIRVLHVSEHGPDFQTQRCIEHLLGRLGEGFEARVRTIGRGGDWRSVPAGIIGLARERGADVVHAWGVKALIAAALVARGPIVYSPAMEARRGRTRFLRAVMSCRRLQVVCPTETMLRGLLRERIVAERCQVIRPGVDFGRIRKPRDPAIRAALGFGDSDYVLAAAGESTRAASHEQAAWVAGILHVLDPIYKLLLWGRGSRLGFVKAFARSATPASMLHVATERLGREASFEEVLSAADVIVNTAGEGGATLPLAISMAAGVPIVSTVTRTVCELIEDRHNAVLVPKRSPRLMAQRILRLREDGELRKRLTATARAEAFQHVPLTRFLEEYRGLYRRVAGAK